MNIKVKIKYTYQEKVGEVIHEYGYPEFNGDDEGIEGLMFWYEEGNGSCDCNRARIIGNNFNNYVSCGQEIKFTSIEPLMDTLE